MVNDATVGGTPIEGSLAAPAAPLQPIGSPTASAQGRTVTPGLPTLEAPSYAWDVSSADILPGQRPVIAGRTAWGDPIPDPGPSIIPWAVVANRQQALSKDRQKLEAEIAAWDPYKDMPEVSPAYSASFQKVYMDKTQGRINDALKAYGGDYKKAYQALRSPATPLGSELKKEQLALLTIARKSEMVTKDAEATMMAMDEGKAEYDQEVYDSADAALRGLENGGDVMAVADSLEQFQTTKEFNSFMKESGLNDVLKNLDFTKETLTIPRGRDRNGMLVYETIGTADPAAKEKIIQGTMASVVPKYRKRYGDEGLRQRIESRLDAKTTSEAKIIDPYHAPTGAANTPRAGYNFGNVGVSAGFTPAQSGTQEVFGLPTGSGGRLGAGLDPGTAKVPTLALTETTGDKTKEIGNRRFNDDKGNPHQLYGAALKKIGGEWKVVGRELTAKEVETLTREFKTAGVPEEEIPTEINKRVETNSIGALRTYNASDNNPEIKGYIGTSDLDGLWNGLNGGGAAQPAQVPMVTSQSAYDALPVGAKYRTADGKELTKK